MFSLRWSFLMSTNISPPPRLLVNGLKFPASGCRYLTCMHAHVFPYNYSNVSCPVYVQQESINYWWWHTVPAAKRIEDDERNQKSFWVCLVLMGRWLHFQRVTRTPFCMGVYLNTYKVDGFLVHKDPACLSLLEFFHLPFSALELTVWSWFWFWGLVFIFYVFKDSLLLCRPQTPGVSTASAFQELGFQVCELPHPTN